MSTQPSAFATEEGFDVIGDVHGYAGELEALLHQMGWALEGDVWTHPCRRAIFVGDLIDRGPRQLDSVMIAKRMVDAGRAMIVAGNHEFNAAAFHTPNPTEPSTFLRSHSDKHVHQHRAFLDQVPPGAERDAIIDWFMDLPLWLEVDGLRVVHACWDGHAIDLLRSEVGENNSLTAQLLVSATRKQTPQWQAIEHLLKGPEVPIDPPYLDKDGHRRDRARFQWWLPNADVLSIGALIPSNTKTVDRQPYPTLANVAIDPPVQPYTHRTPVVFGHYWRSGAPTIQSASTVCVDYSAGKGGPLVAYQWSGEAELTSERLVASR